MINMGELKNIRNSDSTFRNEGFAFKIIEGVTFAWKLTLILQLDSDIDLCYNPLAQWIINDNAYYKSEYKLVAYSKEENIFEKFRS